MVYLVIDRTSLSSHFSTTQRLAHKRYHKNVSVGNEFYEVLSPGFDISVAHLNSDKSVAHLNSQYLGRLEEEWTI